MDDLSQKLNDFLSAPDSMQKIQSVLAALGQGGQEEASPSAPEEPMEEKGALDGESLSALLNALSGGKGQLPEAGRAGPPKNTTGALAKEESSPLPDLSILMKLAPLLSSLRKDDEDTILLKALRPYLHGNREKRLDDAIKIMRFIKVIPLLQSKGLF